MSGDAISCSHRSTSEIQGYDYCNHPDTGLSFRPYCRPERRLRNSQITVISETCPIWRREYQGLRHSFAIAVREAGSPSEVLVNSMAGLRSCRYGVWMANQHCRSVVARAQSLHRANYHANIALHDWEHQHGREPSDHAPRDYLDDLQCRHPTLPCDYQKIWDRIPELLEYYGSLDAIAEVYHYRIIWVHYAARDAWKHYHDSEDRLARAQQTYDLHLALADDWERHPDERENL